MSNLNLRSFSLKPLPLAPSLQALVKSEHVCISDYCNTSLHKVGTQSLGVHECFGRVSVAQPRQELGSLGEFAACGFILPTPRNEFDKRR